MIEEIENFLLIESKTESLQVLDSLNQLSSLFSSTDNSVFWVDFLCHYDTQRNGIRATPEEFLSHLMLCTFSEEKQVLLLTLSCIDSILALRLSSIYTAKESLVGRSLSTLSQPLQTIIAEDDENNTNIVNEKLKISAISIIQRLLPPICPREECSFSMLKEELLLPMSQSSSSSSRITCAMLLKQSIMQTYKCTLHSTRKDEIDKEVISVKAESTALNSLQDWGDIMENLLLHSSPEDDIQFKLIWKDLLKVAKMGIKSRVEGFWSEDDIRVWMGDEDDITKTNVDPVIKCINGQTKSISDDEKLERSTSNSLSKFYSHITGSPIYPQSDSCLQDTLNAISTKLHIIEADRWNDRLQALIDIELLLAANISSSPSFTGIFLTSLHSMNMPEQILDLRSTITRQTCRVIQGIAREFKAACSPLLEQWLPCILQLCRSGVKIMALQGISCIYSVVAFVGDSGVPKIMPQLTEQILQKKNHFHVKKAGVMGITTALRVWKSHSLDKHIKEIERALIVGMSDRDPTVREEARKGIWAMYSCPKYNSLADSIIQNLDSGGQKRLMACKDDCDKEWLELGRFHTLILTGKEGKLVKKTSKPRSIKSKNRTSVKARNRPWSAPVKTPSEDTECDSSVPSVQSTKNKTTDTVANKQNAKSLVMGCSKSPIRQRSGKKIIESGALNSHNDCSDAKSTNKKETKNRNMGSSPVRSRSGRKSIGPGITSTGYDSSDAKAIKKKNANKRKSLPSSRERSGLEDSPLLNHEEKKKSNRILEVTPILNRKNPTDKNSQGSPFRTAKSKERISLKEKTNALNETAKPNKTSKGEGYTEKPNARSTLDSKKQMRSPSTGRSQRSLFSKKHEMRSAIRPTIGRTKSSTNVNLDATRPRLSSTKARTSSNSTRSLMRLDSSLIPFNLDYFLKSVSSDKFQKREDALDLLATSLNAVNPNFDLQSFIHGEVNVSNFVRALSSLMLDHTMRVYKAALSATKAVLMNEEMSAALTKTLPDIFIPIMNKMAEKLSSHLAEECWSASETHIPRQDIIIMVLSLIESRFESPRNTLTELAVTISLEKVKSTLCSSFSFDTGIVLVKSCAEMLLLLFKFQRMASRTKSQLFDVKKMQSNVLDLLLQIKKVVLWKYKFCFVLTKIPKELEDAIVQTTALIKDKYLDQLYDDREESKISQSDQSASSNDPGVKSATKTGQKILYSTVDQPGDIVTEEEREHSELISSTKPFSIETREFPSEANLSISIVTRVESHAQSQPSDPLEPSVGRPDYFSPQKLSRKHGKPPLSDIISLYSKNSSSTSSHPDANSQVKALIQCAKENRGTDCWEKQFVQVLNCLLDGITGTFENVPVQNHILPQTEILTSCMSSTVSELSAGTAQANKKHLYLQGIRALIKYQSSHFSDYVEIVIDTLLECTKDCTFEITHTAEKALENLVTTQDPIRCLRCIIPYLGRIHEEIESIKSSTIVLSSFRTLCKVINAVPQHSLLEALPSFMPCIYKALSHKSVDMRKASVFCIVEMYLVLGWEVLDPFLDGLSIAQRKLVNIYVDRHESK